MTRGVVGSDHPALTPSDDLAVARQLIADYRSTDAAQLDARNQILGFIDQHEDALYRSCLPGHLTASALVTDAARQRVILLHHRKLGRWLQPGGHCDGDANLPAVALRESSEETSIDGLRVMPTIIDLDVHEIPEFHRDDSVVPAHLHLDCRFLVIAPEGAEPRANDESEAVRWFSLDEAHRRGGDASVRRLIERYRRTGCDSRSGKAEAG